MAPLPVVTVDPAIIAAITNNIVSGLSGGLNAPHADKPGEPVLSPIDRLLGGSKTTGLKTLAGVAGVVLTWLTSKTGALDPNGLWFDVLISAFSLLGGAGALAKVDRFLRSFVLIAQTVATAAPKIVDAATAAQEALAKRIEQEPQQ